MRLFFLHIPLVCALLGSAADHMAYASPPLPQSKKEVLESLSDNLEQEKKQKKSLEGKVRKMKKEMGSTQERLIDLSRSVQNNEKTLEDLEKRIEEQQIKEAEIQEKLKKDRRSTARLILALERIRRVPPEALIIRPGASLKTAQSALLMRDIIPVIHRQSKELQESLKKLDEITNDLEEKREAALKTAERLKTEQSKLSGLLDKRQALYASLNTDLETREKNVKRISMQAKNLQDLVEKLEEERKSAPAPTPVYSGGGDARLPVSGVVRIGYGQPDAFGAPHQGLRIEGRDNALVVAPMKGTVRFAGHFKNYGNMIIIEHKGGYHSLIAGLEKIDTVVGQNLSAGEPVGHLRRGENGQKASLYFELRLNGHAVDPASRFSGLS